jgi:hypothetical protein
MSTDESVMDCEEVETECQLCPRCEMYINIEWYNVEHQMCNNCCDEMNNDYVWWDCKILVELRIRSITLRRNECVNVVMRYR